MPSPFPLVTLFLYIVFLSLGRANQYISVTTSFEQYELE